MLDCFKNIVGLRGSCNYQYPKSGLYVNDLPGVTLARFAATATDEISRGEELFEVLYNQAVTKVVNLFRSKLCEDFYFDSIIEKRNVGVIGSEFSEYNKQLGFEWNYYTNDKYQIAHIEDISFTAKNGGKATMMVQIGQNVETREIIVKEGYNCIQLDIKTKEYVRIELDHRIWIADKINCFTSCECFTTCGCYRIKPIYRNVDCARPCGDWQEGRYGLQVSVSVLSDDTPLLCHFAEKLAEPLQLMTGIKLMQDAIVSDSTHPLIRNGKEDIERLLKMWQGGENTFTGEKQKSEFWQSFGPICKQAKSYLKKLNSDCVVKAESDWGCTNGITL